MLVKHERTEVGNRGDKFYFCDDKLESSRQLDPAAARSTHLSTDGKGKLERPEGPGASHAMQMPFNCWGRGGVNRTLLGVERSPTALRRGEGRETTSVFLTTEVVLFLFTEPRPRLWLGSSPLSTFRHTEKGRGGLGSLALLSVPEMHFPV